MSGRNSEDPQTHRAMIGFDEDVLATLVDRPATLTQADAPQTPRVGSLVGLAEAGRTPLVTYRGQPGTKALRARTTVDLHTEHVGRRVALLFDGGNPAEPLIVGLLRDDADLSHSQPSPQVDIETDGERLLVSAARQVVIRCGEASITLTRSGKVLIKGTYVSTHSTGVNRIKGGSVQVN